MSQLGGSTTESGILFQNSIAALYLGDLLDSGEHSDSGRVTAVRVEAPTHVDDTVVTYGDGHRIYIQAKERLMVKLSKIEAPSQDQSSDDETEEIESSGESKLPPWVGLWRDFEAQFFDDDFRWKSEAKKEDRLLLFVGRETNPLYLLGEICLSADGANNATEWFNNLPKKQSALVKDKIQPLLKSENQKLESLFALLGHVDVEFCSLASIEKHQVARRMPACSIAPATLFDLLVTATARNARNKKEFNSDKLRAELRKQHGIEFKASASIQSIRDAVARCNLGLKSTRNTIGQKGEHQPRAVTQDIVDWLCRSYDAADNVAFVHTSAGMGKTVVLHDVLTALEERDMSVPVLAIKADSQLRQLSSNNSIEKCLNLPDSIARVAERLAQLQPERGVVVILDQLDALSLSLAHDQFALDEVVKLVTQLRAIPDVRVLLSCRTFDLNTDPTLKSLPRKSEFPIDLFSSDEATNALSKIGVDASVLSPATLELLRVPLHLDLLALAIENRPDQLQQTEGASLLGGVSTLQDLHELLWDAVVENSHLPADEIPRRNQVISLLIEQMQKTQKTSVSKSFWTHVDRAGLRQVVQSLAGAGILVEDKTGWRFWHQTFYDYCTARHFAEGTESLAQSILESDQGLPQRPRMIQILAFLRAKDEERYLQSLAELLESTELEDHLQDLLVRWFAGLQNPTEFEWEVAQTQFEDSEKRRQFLQRAGNGTGWFDWTIPNVLPALFRTQNSDEETDGINYLRSMLNLEMGQERAARFLSFYLDADPRWNQRLAHMLALVGHWWSEAAVALFEEVCSRWLEGRITGDYSLCEQLPRIIESSCANAPAVTCRILYQWFSVVLDHHASQYGQSFNLPPDPTDEELKAMSADELNDNIQETLELLYPSAPDPLQAFSNETAHYILREILDRVAEHAPREFMELVVFVVERVVLWTRSKPRFGFKHDPLIGVFPIKIGENIHRPIDCLLHDGILIASKVLAEQPDILRPFIVRLEKLGFATPQAYIAAIYRQNPEQFAGEAVNFLCHDVRRLYLGFATQSDSASLIATIFPFLDEDQRQRLETAITQFEITDYWRDDDTPDQELETFRGRSQLRLLLPITRELLTLETQKILQRLESKFPEMEGYRPLETENVAGSVRFVNSDPELVEPDAVVTLTKEMSDDDWVRVIKHHTNRHQLIKAQLSHETPNSLQLVEEEDFSDLEFPNDAHQIAKGKFKGQVAVEPERFIQLAVARLPRETHMPFVCALLESLTDSQVPSIRIYEAVRHFEPAVAPFIFDTEFWRHLAAIVEARKEEGVPDYILEMLERHLQAMALPTVTNSSSGRNQRRMQHGRRIQTDKLNLGKEAELNEEEEDEIQESNWLNMGPMIDYLNEWPHHHIFEALMKGLAANEREAEGIDEAAEQNYRQRRWQWIEWAAEDPSDAVRCGSLIFLRELFETEQQRAFKLYEKLVADRLELLAMFYSMEVLRHGIVWFYASVAPYIEQLLNAEQAATAQRGAFLAAIAAWHGNEVARVDSLLQGRPAFRRGIAKVWASRAFAGDITLEQKRWCRDGLQSLLNDNDVWVQRRLNRVVLRLSSSDWDEWQPFLQALIGSPALSESFDAIAKYIWKNGKSHRTQTLDFIEKLIQNPVSRRRGFAGYGGDPLVRAVLNVYKSPLTTSDVVKKRCIKLFGRLLRDFSGDGNKALNEWDRAQFTLG